MLSAPDFNQKKIILALLSHGDKLNFKNDNIIISDENGVKHQSSCYRLFALFVVGHMTITTGLLQRSKKFGFSIVLLTHGLIPYGSWLSRADGNVMLRKKQYNYSGNDIAQHLVVNKIEQQIKALKQRRNKSADLKQAITNLVEYKSRLPDANIDLQGLLGIEGISSRVYFKQMFDNAKWRGRQPRTKQDITNLLLDIGYTQLFHFIDALLGLYGFDSYQGVYHRNFYQRKSLVCDLVEPFRVIIDKRIRKAWQLSQIHEEDFSYINGQYKIFGQQSKPYISFLLQALLEHKQQIFIYIQSYYRAFMQNKPIEHYPVFLGEEKCS